MSMSSQHFAMLPHHWLKSDTHWFTKNWTVEEIQWREYLIELSRFFNSLLEVSQKKANIDFEVLARMAVSSFIKKNSIRKNTAFIEATLFSHLSTLAKEDLPLKSFLDFSINSYLSVTESLLMESLRIVVTPYTNNQEGEFNFSDLETAAWKRGKISFHECLKDIPYNLTHTIPLAMNWLENSNLFISHSNKFPHYFRKLNYFSDLDYQKCCLGCKNTLETKESPIIQDSLCKLHYHWVRGFLFELNNQIIVEQKTNKSCRIQLTIHASLPKRSYEEKL